MNNVPDTSKIIDQFAHHSEMVKCPHCKKECDPETPEAEFICWHGLCAECELKGVRDGLNRRQ